MTENCGVRAIFGGMKGFSFIRRKGGYRDAKEISFGRRQGDVEAGDGEMVSKDHVNFDAVGTVDELNCILGLGQVRVRGAGASKPAGMAPEHALRLRELYHRLGDGRIYVSR